MIPLIPGHSKLLAYILIGGHWHLLSMLSDGCKVVENHSAGIFQLVVKKKSDENASPCME